MPHTDPHSLGLLSSISTPEERAGLVASLPLLTAIILGGIASHIERTRRDKSGFSFWGAVGDVIISGFSGYMAFLVCRAVGIEGDFVYVITGVMSYYGTVGIHATVDFLASSGLEYVKILQKVKNEKK